MRQRKHVKKDKSIISDYIYPTSNLWKQLIIIIKRHQFRYIHILYVV